jgi:nitrous oxidase accessory protein NosD
MASGSSIYVGGTSGSPLTGRITDNTMEGGSSCLLLVFPKGLLIRDNTLANCGNFGIKLGSTETLASVCGGNLVEHNTITGTGIGIYVGGEAGGNQVVDNVMQADGIGILAWSASNRIAENTIFASDDAAPLGAGIAVTGPRNLIEGNMIGGTTPGCGLLFYGSAATENSWRNNMLRANAGGPVCFVAGGTGSNDGGNVF